MNSFVCDQCGCVDIATPGGGTVCTECRTGEWHHMFDKVEYDPDIHKDVINRPNTQSDNDSEVSFS